MSISLKKRACALLSWLSQPGIVFYTLPLLMALLVAGTVAQRYIGLYDAQHRFFSSFILWLGPLPLPGGYALSTLIGTSLLVKFLCFSRWDWRKAGINLTHLGILILLFGGLLTAINAREGFMVIPEGQQSSHVADYHQRELVIRKNGDLVTAIPHQKIAGGREIAPALPFKIAVLEACRNCAIERRTENSEHFRGMAQFMALKAAPPEPEDEANLYGATIEVSGAGAAQDGKYIIFELMPEPVALTIGDDRYELLYRKAQRPLPFAVKLEDFQENFHPATAMARAYSSDIVILDDGLRWPVRIEMNKPLRYKGYTFFQSSFDKEEDGAEVTVLAVVQNSGWLFPYLGTLVVAIGLLLHTFIIGAARARKP